MKNFLKNSVDTLDILSWILVIAFFCGSALAFDGELTTAVYGAVMIIIEMFVITIAIEIIIECLKKTRGIGTITGFITNGPEAIVLIAGLVAGDIIFAASTPLGSNFMNPLLLVVAALVSGKFVQMVSTCPTYSVTTCLLTAGFAGSFFCLNQQDYFLWLLPAIVVTGILFYIRPQEVKAFAEKESDILFKPRYSLVPAILLLAVAGYFLDSVVSQAAEASHAPKGVIGFLVLSTLTSWPELKSCIALLKRNRPVAAILNITVSNITNIWLAATGLIIYLLGTD